MSELNKLVQIVTKRHQRNAPLLSFNDKKITKELKLFYDIQSGNLKLVPRNKKVPDSAELRMTRARLRKKLLNHLFFLNFNDPYIKVSHRYEQECLDMLHQARVLIKEGEYQISEKLLRSALKIAQQTEFTPHILTAIDLLRQVYVQTSQVLHFKKISKNLASYRNLLQKEQEAEELYYTAKLEINRSVSAKKNFLTKLGDILQQLKDLWEQNRSFTIYDLYYKTNIWYHELTNDFGKIITVTSETEQMLTNGALNELRFDDRYNKYIKTYSYLRDRQYAEGLQYAGKHGEMFNRASNNWFAFMENYFLLAMHNGSYDVAAKILGEVNTNPFYQKIRKAAQESWQLYQAYLQFIYPVTAITKQFKYHSFVSSVPEFSKDKQGFNVAILILQFLHFLKNREQEQLLYRIESLKKYAGRHLKGDFSIRSQMFFKLLTLVVKEDLHPEKCRRKGLALADKLAATPPPGDAFAEIEIIPYEHLWEEILRMLAKPEKP
ncbi:hypothetical protein [Adhaeribacter soli]|uniref:Tetratricopeptide repeat protein n=1 Tax=Adhaeribacter soli TaxID=2607655 RepID=A0A5N1IIR3_9BACT|nr:hypothetical protein [Adhaeribacter soli]KAA9325036.1 hypothetical protein F0P94_19200 [Adhaeribacter soli]